ncbi:CCA tRNA nucleotidyltransferase [Anaerolinea thermophila]|uniref:tRNA nucleotidyltransferase n=1 Tax=Anaerolinea thermophila (strain DSM 14523 / JCM 11388 / NBRC 100420 / UNI-1) TaxID=926569 RepID=E8N4T2_ANATU|nr:HD domain-containing protein [Anaerolinea thermophila]BAJ63446.1 putative tRNA nucleotidyltransferase [Anaerolinea thermophila UNI-1]
MIQPFSSDLKRILQVVSRASDDVPVYLVGGAVRDHLLGVESHDLDFCLNASPIPLARRVANALNAGFFLLDEQRETVRVVVHEPDGSINYLDFARFREDSLVEDLWKRDFTINAMALPVQEDSILLQLIDPCGGLQDLRDKRLKACSDSAFEDDPVRVLRLIRFAQKLRFHIDPQTLQDARSSVPSLERVSAERKRDEIFQILESPGARVGVDLLDRLKVLPVVFPELEKLKGVKQSTPHVHDVWRHTLETVSRLEILLNVLAEDLSEQSPAGMMVAQASLWLGRYREQFHAHLNRRLNPLRLLRGLTFFCALFHDVGKPDTAFQDKEGRIRFFGHEELSASLAVSRAQALALSHDEVEHIQKVITGHMRIHWLVSEGQPPSPRAIYRFFRDLGEAGVDVCLLSLSDLWATYSHTLTQEQWVSELKVCRALLEAKWEKENILITPPVLIKGGELIRELGLQPGPLIGQTLEAIREAQVEGMVLDKQSALAFAREWINKSFPQQKEERET